MTNSIKSCLKYYAVQILHFFFLSFFFFFDFEVLWNSQPNGVMLSVVSLSNNTFIKQA